MAGKKNLASKLAKMSDEERARYMQRKAEIEEEAKRRKEQLIATFMKNKIKKEDAFSRLNLAKMNQQWHQILRQAKCNEMKTNIQYLKNYMDRVLSYKNRTIDKLLEELEAVESLYSHNFQSHSDHIDQMIESHNNYSRRLHENYRKDLSKSVETTTKETDDVLENADYEQKHIRTIIFTIETIAEKEAKSKRDHHLQTMEEMKAMFRSDLTQMQKQRINISVAIWEQIAGLIRSYVHRNDARRMHLAELKRIDAESATEIASNQELMKQKEALLEHLKTTETSLEINRKKELKNLEQEIRDENQQILGLKNQTFKEIKFDEEKIKYLASVSNETVEKLEKILETGMQIKKLWEVCQKFESDKEKIDKMSFVVQEEIPSDASQSEEEVSPKIIEKKIKNVILRTKNDEELKRKSKSAPLIKVKEEITDQEKAQTDFETEKPTTAKLVEALSNLEKFWENYSRLDVHYRELVEEKRVLQAQNRQLRGMMRAVLEAAVLSQSSGTSRISTPNGSKSCLGSS